MMAISTHPHCGTYTFLKPRNSVLTAVASVFTAVAVLLFSGAVAADFSGTWQQQWSLDSHGNTQQFESRIDSEWNHSFSALSRDWDMTLIARIKIDGSDQLGHSAEPSDNFSVINGPLLKSQHAQLDIREWYWDTEIAGSYWRIGKQQVVWGQADGLKVLDVVNPQSYREFTLDEFSDSRLPLWMLNIELPTGGDGSWQLLWIPDLSYHQLADAGSDYAFSSPLLVPQIPAQLLPTLSAVSLKQHKPASPIKDSDMGLRYATFVDGWDLTANYLYHYRDAAVYYQSLTGPELNPNELKIDAGFERSHLLGGTASKAFGDFTLRTEVGYNSHSFQLLDSQSKQAMLNLLRQQGVHQSAELSSVFGLDWQGLADTMISAQWFQSYLFGDHRDLQRSQQDHVLSLLYRQNFANESWEFEALALYGLDQQDTSIQLQLSYMLESNLELWLSTDLFSGPAPSMLGQFDQSDRLSLGFEWGF